MAIYLKYCETDQQFMAVEVADDELNKMIDAGEVVLLPEGMPIEVNEQSEQFYSTKDMAPKKKVAKKKAAKKEA